jgi:hypothetical protein
VTGDPLVTELRRFILSYAEHDPDCPGIQATGDAATSVEGYRCGLIRRMEELLAELERRLRPA